MGDTSFAVLPEVTKEHTFALTIFFQIVSSPMNVEFLFWWSMLTKVALFGKALVAT